MKLIQLIANLDILEVRGDPDIEVSGLHYDSRQIQAGFLFVAISGFKTDGHRFIPDALEKGASALVVEKLVEVPADVVVIVVSDSRVALSKLAATYFGFPSSHLRMIGVTGTNGKTTTTHLVEAILTQAGYQVSLIGTIGNRISGKEIKAVHTTPESLDLQSYLAQMIENKEDYAVIEVSSHALALHRIEDCEIDVAVFTNLSQDHLDFHQNMEEYRDAKLKLFHKLGEKTSKDKLRYAVVNIDDPEGETFISVSPVEVVTYGIDKPAMIQAHDLHITPYGTSFKAVLPSEEINIKMRLTGRFSVYNALAALAVGWREAISTGVIQSALAGIKGVSGRFELVDGGQDFAVVVDYAHTPDGLQNVLQTAREVAENRVITVFGCGGDRDRTKRPLMGKVTAELSDYVIVTSDNPRTEDPGQIIEDIIPGVKKVKLKDYEIIQDRRQAIARALEIARKGDVVIIAGKGHETYQLVGNRVLPFDDREVAKEILLLQKTLNRG